MNECPECGVLLIEDVDDEDFGLNPTTVLYCPGCGWSSNDPQPDDDEDSDYDELCPSCGGRGGNHRAACSEDDAIYY